MNVQQSQDSKIFRMALTPAIACRVPIFAPTRRPTSVTSLKIETSWGWGIVTGRLGQQHRDLLDAALYVAEDQDETSDGIIHLLVDRAKLRVALGGDAVNFMRIDSWLNDLMQAKVEVHVDRIQLKVTGALISEVVNANKIEPKTRSGAFNKGRRYLRISFGSTWSKLIQDDRMINYPLMQVVALQHGFSQATARYCWSHSNVNDSVEGLTKKLAAGGRIRDRTADLENDANKLAEIGINFSNGKIYYKRANKIESSQALRVKSW